MIITKKLLRSLFLFVLLTVAASAAPALYTLQGVVFADGGAASGSFVYDAVTNTYSNVSITTTTGAVRTGATFTFVNGGLGLSNPQVLYVSSTTGNQTGCRVSQSSLPPSSRPRPAKW